MQKSAKETCPSLHDRRFYFYYSSSSFSHHRETSRSRSIQSLYLFIIIHLTIVYVIQYNRVEVKAMVEQTVLSQLIVELRRGTQILFVLSQLKDMQYGYSLLQSLEDKDVNIEAGTLYPLLRRLESQGILSSQWDTTESRPRKYYTLSDDGRELYAVLKQEWNTISKEMDALLKEDSK